MCNPVLQRFVGSNPTPSITQEEYYTKDRANAILSISARKHYSFAADHRVYFGQRRYESYMNTV